MLNHKSILTSCLAGVFGGKDVSEPRSGPFGPRAVLAMFAIVRLSWLLVISLSSALASPSASGLHFDAGCVVAFSGLSFAAECRGGSVPLGAVVVAIGWVLKSSTRCWETESIAVYGDGING